MGSVPTGATGRDVRARSSSRCEFHPAAQVRLLPSFLRMRPVTLPCALIRLPKVHFSSRRTSMNRRALIAGVAGIGLVAGLIAWQASKTGATQGPEGGAKPVADNGNGKAKGPDPLPIKHVVLFNSGV